MASGKLSYTIEKSRKGFRWVLVRTYGKRVTALAYGPSRPTKSQALRDTKRMAEISWPAAV